MAANTSPPRNYRNLGHSVETRIISWEQQVRDAEGSRWNLPIGKFFFGDGDQYVFVDYNDAITGPVPCPFNLYASSFRNTGTLATTGFQWTTPTVYNPVTLNNFLVYETIFTPAYSYTVPLDANANSIIAVYNFDGPQGNTVYVDSTGNYSPMTRFHGNGSDNSALQHFSTNTARFDGNTIYNTPLNPSFNLSANVWAIECWFYPQDGTGNQQIIWEYSGALNPGTGLTRSRLYLNANRAYFQGTFDNGTDLADQSNLTMNVWHHMVVCTDKANSYLKLYLDGTLRVQANGINVSNIIFNSNSNANVILGGDGLSAVQSTYYTGHIEDFCIRFGANAISMYTGSTYTLPNAPTSVSQTTVNVAATNVGPTLIANTPASSYSRTVAVPSGQSAPPYQVYTYNVAAQFSNGSSTFATGNVISNVNTSACTVTFAIPADACVDGFDTQWNRDGTGVTQNAGRGIIVPVFPNTANMFSLSSSLTASLGLTFVSGSAGNNWYSQNTSALAFVKITPFTTDNLTSVLCQGTSVGVVDDIGGLWRADLPFTSWTNRGSNVASKLNFLGDVLLADGSEYWITVGDFGQMAVGNASSNYTNFIPVVSGNSRNFHAVTTHPSSNQRAMIVGDSGTILLSAVNNPYGTWSAQTSPSAVDYLCVYTRNSAARSVIGCSDGTVVRWNGTAWVSVNTGLATKISGIVYDTVHSVWIAVGAGGKIITSPDETTWTLRNSGTTNDLNAVGPTGLKDSVNLVAGILAVGNNGTAIYSTDGGVTWTAT